MIGEEDSESEVDMDMNRLVVHHSYARIAMTHYDSLREQARILLVVPDALTQPTDVALGEYGHLYVTAIVFTAMAVEAYIYDYGVSHLGRNFVSSHIERENLVGKWAVIPQLVTGKKFPTDNGLLMLKKLVSTRNSLVHFKSKSIGSYPNLGLGNINMDVLNFSNATNAIDTMTALYEDLVKIDPGARSIINPSKLRIASR